MGLKCSQDFAEEVQENIFRDVEDADVYIDDVGVFSKESYGSINNPKPSLGQWLCGLPAKMRMVSKRQTGLATG